MDPAFEAGQLEVSVRVDEARKDGGVIEVGGRNSMRVRDGGVCAHSLKPPIRPDQDCSALDGVTFDRNQPAGGQAARPHFSAADSGSGRSLPLLPPFHRSSRFHHSWVELKVRVPEEWQGLIRDRVHHPVRYRP